MSVQPLKDLGFWRAQEGAFELTVPLFIMGGAWYAVITVLSAPATGRGYTTLELAALLGAAVALTAWAASRQMFMLRRRKPIHLVALASVYVAAILFIVPARIKSNFATACEEQFAGQLVLTTDPVTEDLLPKPDTGPLVCRIGGVADNSYLPGTLLRPTWSGTIPALMWPYLFGVGAIAALGLRDRRVRPSKLSSRLGSLLRFAPAYGHASASGKPKAKEGRLVACTNATLWGELCGQLYSADKVWEPGEWCVRCTQAFRRCDRELTFKVVSLYTTDVDVLNGLERTDTVSWDRGEPMTPDARISGAERWVTLGTVTVPDVISVAQTLSVVHDLLPKWMAEADERTKEAIRLAQRNASKVSGWVWFGTMAHRLTYARPTRRALLAIGPTRWRDIVTEGGEELWLQLDVGLLPLELRVGFMKRHSDEGRPPDVQNSKVDLWIPVSPPRLPKKEAGIWVPRIEGQALRTWLSTERLRADAEAGGVSIPLPYHRYTPEDEGGDVRVPRPGSLDFVRFALARNGMEPESERSIGDSIADWEWLEWEQIQLLRQQCLVLTETNPRSG